MLTFMPLFIEIVLLAVTAYFCWLTRQMITRHRAESKSAGQIEMMQDVAALLGEWQSAAGAAREESLRQQAGLQESLRQAEKTIAELRFLVAHSETSKVVAQKQAGHNLSAEDDLKWLPATMAEAIVNFSNHLRKSNYSQVTIIRTASRAQHFVNWLERWASAQVPVRRIDSGEIETYRRDLTDQPDQADLSIEREITAIKIFAAWINDLCDCHPSPDRVELNGSVPALPLPPQPPISTRQAPSPHGADRYRSVFYLADQGLDPASITAQTGLEREAVRLLLSIGHNKH